MIHENDRAQSKSIRDIFYKGKKYICTCLQKYCWKRNACQEFPSAFSVLFLGAQLFQAPALGQHPKAARDTQGGLTHGASWRRLEGQPHPQTAVLAEPITSPTKLTPSPWTPRHAAATSESPSTRPPIFLIT